MLSCSQALSSSFSVLSAEILRLRTTVRRANTPSSPNSVCCIVISAPLTGLFVDVRTPSCGIKRLLRQFIQLNRSLYFGGNRSLRQPDPDRRLLTSQKARDERIVDTNWAQNIHLKIEKSELSLTVDGNKWCQNHNLIPHAYMPSDE